MRWKNMLLSKNKLQDMKNTFVKSITISFSQLKQGF